jgi:hypothetical protein
LLARIDKIVETYYEKIQTGAKALADPRSVSAAREVLRSLLVEGRIVMTPDSAHTALTGEVRFVDLGDHVLEQAGTRRRLRHLPTEHVTVVAGAGFEPATLGL